MRRFATFHYHYCAMVISYNVANYFFGGVRVVFSFFFCIFLGVGNFVLGDFVRGFVWEGFCGAFCRGGGEGLPGVLSGGAFVEGGFDGEGLSRFFVNEVFVAWVLSGGFCQRVLSGWFCRFFCRRGVCRGVFAGGGFVGGFL